MIIMTGDFNFHMDVLSNPEAEKLRTCLGDLDLIHVDKPTHIGGHTLDLVIAPKENTVISTVTVLDKSISDHYMIIVDLCVPKPKLEKRHVTSRNMKQLNTNNFMNDVLKCISTKQNL